MRSSADNKGKAGFSAALFQQLVSAYQSRIDVDQQIKGEDSLGCIVLIRKIGECVMMEIVIIVSAVMAALSVGSIAMTLLLISIEKI